MTITTTQPPEAQLEARIHATLARVFTGITELRHQLRFKLRVGRTVLEAGTADYVEGRADIIVYRGDVAVAVLELKRQGLTLTADDEAQGRSYALLAQAPIVVITNGTDTRIYQTHDMEPLTGTTVDEAELERRFKAAATAAQSGVSSAISKLLGTDLARGALAALTSAELDELTGDWNAGERFVDQFLVPRQATRELRTALRSGLHKVLLVAGPPLSGKSSVLRELALKSNNETWDILFVEGSSCSEGLFRRLANVLAMQFGWPATPDESRVWLRQLASQSQRILILCIDSLPMASTAMASELDELLATFGERMRIVVAADENDVDALTLKPNGRERTRLGRHSVLVKVGNYDDEEFDVAKRELWALGGGLVDGAQYAPELRAPWVLRAAIGSSMHGNPPGSVIMLPPLLGVEMFDVADERFASLGELRDDFRQLAAVYLEDLDTHRHQGDVLAAMYLFSVRQEVVRKHIERDAIRDLTRAGLIRRGTAFSGDTVYVIRVPELFGFEVAARLAVLLPRRVSKGADDAAKWIINTCSRMPLGDAIGAHAISRALHDLGGAGYLALINGLLKQPPRQQRLGAGARMVTLMPGHGLVDIEVGENGTLTLRSRAKNRVPLQVTVDDEDLTTMTSMDGWLILSQMREFRLAFVDSEEALSNVAATLLLELGTCPMVMRRPSRDLEGFHTHEIEGAEMSCFRNGIAEPVVWAISELLLHELPGVDRDAWVQAAAASDCPPLIHRLGLALTHIARLEGKSEWANDMLERFYRPAWSALPAFH
jgi:hypothetical protein